ncbi:MAG: ectonucleotide pyrophosphatase/phosphodiesterase [Gemmatimonadota bacterium]|nr:ectonucleotide pyrophosphatase/phosphodiesterase [Gemmatimonadota bacterium]
MPIASFGAAAAKRAALVVLAASCGAAPLAHPTAHQSSPQPARTPVVVISIDGLKPDYVLEADKHGLKIPNLRRFVATGSYASGVRGVVPTVTYPSHTTLVTGASPARHRILSNTTFDPFNKNQGGWYWYADDIAIPTLWDAAREAGLVTTNVHWPVTVGARITWNIPQVWRTGEPDDRKLVRALSTPNLVADLERELAEPYPDGADETIEGDERRARFGERLIVTKRPAFALTYFTALDHAQHESGPYSADAIATLERIDAIIGRIERAARQAHGGRVVVAVVSDHGFVPVQRQFNPGVALREAGLLEFSSPDDDKPKSWRAAAWISGGVAGIVIRDSTDADARSRVAALLARLKADSANRIAAVIDATELRARGGYTGAAFLINLRAGMTMGSALKGTLISETKTRGMHGYLPDDPRMQASFFVAGAGVAAGRNLGLIDQRDIAPTLARFLGLTLATAEGKLLLP